MYSRRLSQSTSGYPNLKILLLENKKVPDQFHTFSFMIRQIATGNTIKNIRSVRDKVELIIKNSKLLGTLRDKFFTVPRSLKDQSSNVLRVWAHQCECVFAQRLRRGQQMFCLYSKLWEERALREFMKQMRETLGNRGRNFVIGALGVGYDWGTNRISEQEIRKHKNEFDYVYKLKEKTVCDKCNPNSRICQCQKSKPDKPKKQRAASYDDWKLFIEKNDLVVWRKLTDSGHYQYKVYGSYSDVSAEDFLNVQIDVNYRRQWDTTAVVLNIVETDPEPLSNSDIIYWEMLWPKLFTNRDYVFNRRYLVDHKSKTLFLVSKSTKHPKCPKEPNKFRIEDYWSYMVIKPYTDLNKPGIEFSLTYFDNPGLNIPSSVTNWVAIRAMPDFLERLRDASKKYRSYCQKEGISCVCNIMDGQIEDDEDLTMDWDYLDDDIITDNTIYEAHYKIKASVKTKKPSKKPPQQISGDSEGSNPTNPQGTNVQPENHSFWRESR